MADELIFKDPYESKVTPVKMSMTSPLREVKKKLLQGYRQEKQSILDREERTAAGFNTDQLLNLIVEDMLDSTEDLQGTALMLENEGNLQGASVISIKRADLMKLISDILSKKKELSQRSGEVDLNSPAFTLFQKLCFENLAQAMEEIKMEPEQIGLLLQTWQDKMEHWDKDLRKMLKDLEE